MIALQCSIMRHLSIKQKAVSAASTAPSADVDRKKPCATSEDIKTLASLERTSSSEPCFKPCPSPENPQGACISRDPPAELGVCKCRLEPCQNCRKPNGPVAEPQPTKTNGPVDCKGPSDPCRQAELQHRLKSDSAPTPELPNHIGTKTVKKDPESTTEACAQNNCPTGPTIWPPSSQQNHQMELQEERTSREEKPSLSITSRSLSDSTAKGPQDQESSLPPTGNLVSVRRG